MSLAFDIKCFIKTIGSVIRSDGFVEGKAAGENVSDEKEEIKD